MKLIYYILFQKIGKTIYNYDYFWIFYNVPTYFKRCSSDGVAIGDCEAYPCRKSQTTLILICALSKTTLNVQR